MTDLRSLTDEQLEALLAAPDDEVYSEFESMGLGAAQGATFATSDELEGLVRSGAQYLENSPFLIPKGFAAPYDEGVEIARQRYKTAQAQNPISYLAGETLGTLVPSLAGAGVLAKGAPSVARSAQSYAGANPLRTAAGVGGVQGGVYGFGSGEGGYQERAEKGLYSGMAGSAGGVVGGKLFSLASEGMGQAFSPIAQLPIVKKAASIFQRKKAIRASKEFQPQPQPQPEGYLPSKAMGNVARLPKGARDLDIEQMRVEEAARQGMLNSIDPSAQNKMKAIDDIFHQDVEKVARGLANNSEDRSDDVFAGIANRVRNRYSAAKKLNTRLMEERNLLIGKAGIYKDYTKDTLGKNINELVSSPELKASISMLPTDNPIKKSVEYLNKLTGYGAKETGKFNKPIDFAMLAGWRKSLNSLSPSSAEYQIGKKFAAEYDEWLDGITKNAFINADDDMVSKIFAANKSYSAFKNKYGTDKFRGQSRAIQDIVEKTELTPMQLSNLVMGKTLNGRNDSTQTVKRMLEIVPEGAKSGMKDDIRRGLVLRALENSRNRINPEGNLSVKVLKADLLKLINSEPYRLYLKDEAFDKTVNGLIDDIGKFINAQSRKEVYSPSGPMIARFADRILAGLGIISIPAGGKLVTDTLRAGIKKGADQAAIRPAANALQKTLNEFAEQSIKESATNARIYGAAASAPSSAAFVGAVAPDIQEEDLSGYSTEELEKMLEE